MTTAERLQRNKLATPFSLRRVAAFHAVAVLGLFKGNKSETVRALGISYHTLNGLLRDAQTCLTEPGIDESRDAQAARLATTYGLPLERLRVELLAAETRGTLERIEADDENREDAAGSTANHHL